MTNRMPRPVLAVCFTMMALLLGGCKSAQPEPTASDRADSDPAPEVSETQSVAEAALGKHAEVLTHGDLARNGLEQVFAVNRQTNAQRGDAGPGAISISRAAILEKRDGKWTEVLRCDERLKNPDGYLAGSPAARVSGWSLEYSQDAARGLEMKFTPAGGDVPDAAQASDGSESTHGTIVVRWNTGVKRYQSLDASHQRFQNEVPTLVTPSSILK